MTTPTAVQEFTDQWTPQADPLQFADQSVICGDERCRILAVDQHLRWKHGCPREIHYYVQHWPQGSASNELLIRLLIDEFSYREESGQRVSTHRFLQELTGLPLAIRNELNEALGGQGDRSWTDWERETEATRIRGHAPAGPPASLAAGSHATVEKPEHPLVYQIVGTPLVYVPDRHLDSFLVGRQRRRRDDPGVGCDFVIRCADSRSKSLKISRRHLRLYRSGDHTYVVNQSKLGTKLNGRSLPRGTSEIIHAGDRLSVAGVLALHVLSRNQVVPQGPMQGGQVVRLDEYDTIISLEAPAGELTRIVCGTQREDCGDFSPGSKGGWR